MNKLILLLAGFVLSSCVSAPTKVIESYEVPEWQRKQLEQVKKGFSLSPDAIIFDARPFFLYKLSHLEGAHSLSPSDFFNINDSGQIELSAKHFFNARRLSRYGTGKETPVVSVGRAKSGEGEEWLLALYLEYLGLSNVEPVSQQLLNFKQTSLIPVMPKSQPTWKPRIDQGLIVTRQALENTLKSDPKLTKDYVIIDASEPDQYLESSARIGFEAKRINIPWTEFIDENSRPRVEIFSKLISVGIIPRNRILCIGAKPGYAATACMVLRRMGFSESGLFVENEK